MLAQPLLPLVLPNRRKKGQGPRESSRFRPPASLPWELRCGRDPHLLGPRWPGRVKGWGPLCGVRSACRKGGAAELHGSADAHGGSVCTVLRNIQAGCLMSSALHEYIVKCWATLHHFDSSIVNVKKISYDMFCFYKQCKKSLSLNL